jgi:hypothetical protein
MNTIVERVWGGVSDKRLVLSNQSIARKLQIGNDWTTIRVGIRAWFSNSQSLTTVSGTPRLQIGMQAGDTTLVGGVNTTYWTGVSTANSTFTDDNDSWSLSIYGRGVKQGDTLTETTSTGVTTRLIRAPTEKAWGMVTTLVKTSSTSITYHVTRHSQTTPSSWFHMTMPVFMEGMESDPSAAWANHGLANLSGLSSIPDVSALDSVGICWNRRVPALEISDIVVVRVA